MTINYRLGHFGFLAGNEIAKDGALNAGLRESYSQSSHHDR